MEFALKTSVYKYIPHPGRQPRHVCATEHVPAEGAGRAARWSGPGVPGRPRSAGPRPEGPEPALPTPPAPAEVTPGHPLGRCPGHLLPARPAPSGRPTLRTQPDTRVGASPATPHIGPGPDPPASSALPQTGVAGLRAPQTGGTALPWPCPAHSRGQGGPEAAEVPFTYGVSVQQPLEVVEGADGVVAQHLVELLRNGVPLPGTHTHGIRRAGPPAPHTDTASHEKLPQGPSATDRRTARLGWAGGGSQA